MAAEGELRSGVERVPATANATGVDAYAPAEVAGRVEAAGVVKAALPADKLLVLSVLAGAFIGFGAAFYTVAVSDPGLGFGPTRLLGGLAFSLGLVLVIVAGAELFTGNALIVMAWAEKRVTSGAVARNWAYSFLGNAVGAVGLAVAVYLSGVLGAGLPRETAIRIAETKMALPFVEAFVRGILCNVLVCLAVWLCFAARSVTDKILAIVFPITAFVALGFEHSIANLYLLPVGLLAGAEGGVAGLVGNLVPVTLGNIVGGAGGVAAVYWVIYLRK
ncbi:MAG: formate/nitrite transporter family protein [Bauldia sp.]